MAVLLYARVSTVQQAERELSIPAQFHLMERYAKDHGLTVVGQHQDVASGRSLRERPGLLAALHEATHRREIDGLLVHKLDRLSRDTFNYLVLKGKLRSAGVRIYSVVESLETNPMGEFIEHIMAAQAEFYSANLATEVKKGLDERLRRGLWTGLPPMGYRKEHGRVVFDPARAPHMRHAFERWATGTMTSIALAEELWQAGLVSIHNKKVAPNRLCALLQNPFYIGKMVAGGGTYVGVYPPLIADDLFERCQAVFRKKHGGRSSRKHHSFLLSQLVCCPYCGSLLVGEQHQKPSGKVYRYYRCNQKVCRFYVRADGLEASVLRQLTESSLPKHILPLLRKQRPSDDSVRLLNALNKVDDIIECADQITKRETLATLVTRIEMKEGRLELLLSPAVRDILNEKSSISVPAGSAR